MIYVTVGCGVQCDINCISSWCGSRFPNWEMESTCWTFLFCVGGGWSWKLQADLLRHVYHGGGLFFHFSKLTWIKSFFLFLYFFFMDIYASAKAHVNIINRQVSCVYWEYWNCWMCLCVMLSSINIQLYFQLFYYCWQACGLKWINDIDNGWMDGFHCMYCTEALFALCGRAEKQSENFSLNFFNDVYQSETVQ